jgi:hypothetical protein
VPVPTTAFALVALLAEGVDVQGSSTCPSPAEVAERIAPLLPAEQGFPPGTVLRVDEGARPGEVEVRLEGDGAQAPLASRRLARTGSCGELAEAAAVVAASWAGRYDTPPPEALAPGDGSRPVVGVRRDREPAAVGAGPDRWSIGLGGGVGAARAGGLTPHGGLEVTATWQGTQWFGRLVLAGTGERWFSVGAGNAAWWRMLAIPSAGLTRGESLFFEASAGPVVGAVVVRGGGFSPNAGDVSVDLGVSPSMRLGYRFGPSARAALWIGASAIAWLRPHKLSVDGSMNDAAIPRFDLLTGLGATFAFGSS